MGSLADRAKEAARYYGMSLVKWQESMGLSNAHFYNCQNVSRKIARILEEKYPEININWLATGKGSKLNDDNKCSEVENYIVPLLPIAAQGGAPDNFESQVKNYDCEMVLCPVRNVTLALTINGDSMSPEYPNGSKVFVQKVNEQSFIEWGCTYVLDTANGAIVKNVFPVKEDESKIICRSVNPNYADFMIDISDIRAWYRVRCCVTIK